MLKSRRTAKPSLPPAETYFQLSKALRLLDRYDEAIGWASKAIDTNPERPGYWASLAISYAMKGDETQARAAAQGVLRRQPDYSVDMRGPPWPGRESEWREYTEKRLRPAVLAAGFRARGP